MKSKYYLLIGNKKFTKKSEWHTNEFQILFLKKDNNLRDKNPHHHV